MFSPDVAGVPEPALPASSRTSVIEGSVLLVEDEEAVLEFERDVLSGVVALVPAVGVEVVASAVAASVLRASSGATPAARSLERRSRIFSTFSFSSFQCFSRLLRRSAGGAMRDEEVVQAANEFNIAMIFTGMRQFRH